MIGRRKRRNAHYNELHPQIYSSQPLLRQQHPGTYFNPYMNSPQPAWNQYSHPFPPYPMNMGENAYYQTYSNNGGNFEATYPADYILQNPLQPKKNQGYGGQVNSFPPNPNPYMHPYPKHGMVQRPPSGFSSVINSFKTQDGNFDINKMLDTAGQMMNAVYQVSGLVKGLGGIFKV